MKILSVNVGAAKPVEYTDAPSGTTGIDKQPVTGPVRVTAPGPAGVGASGVAGDTVCDLRYHGGDDRAVYAFAREDLDAWEQELGRPLANGAFGENLTTVAMDLREALVGERWRVGDGVVLEVTGGRIPCRTFAGRLAEKGWLRRFTLAGSSGAMLRVIEPGEFSAGDRVEVVDRPDHKVTVGRLFRAVTTERKALPEMLVAAEWMEREQLEIARKYAAKYGSR
ncbi:MOSC domain-containing protein [Streptomyces purpurogeneiscleroticus]|uniref:MOSC domain-containing protein n=1 Tax=Streptomyces purpurogeneiscleroticus TaxID=68259 RepID=UPI001CBE7B2A|nr:MOSC domain-containing protein [Streptomyces purpurogeneiscleroticus]MBZ4017253.1 sulfurase [Streptomyces purpurogeneiscleroticus]